MEKKTPKQTDEYWEHVLWAVENNINMFSSNGIKHV